MSFMDEKTLKIAIYLASGIVFLLLLNKLGLFSGNALIDATKEGSKLKGSDTDYFRKVKNKKVTTLPFGGKALAKVCKDIHDSIHFFGIGVYDNKLMEAIYRIKTQKMLSQVQNYYNIVYKKTMLNDLLTLEENVINKFSSNGAYVKIINYFKSLPDA